MQCWTCAFSPTSSTICLSLDAKSLACRSCRSLTAWGVSCQRRERGASRRPVWSWMAMLGCCTMSAPGRDSRKRRRGGRECKRAAHAARRRRQTLAWRLGRATLGGACPTSSFPQAASRAPATRPTAARPAVPWWRCPQKQGPRGATVMSHRQRTSFGCSRMAQSRVIPVASGRSIPRP